MTTIGFNPASLPGGVNSTSPRFGMGARWAKPGERPAEGEAGFKWGGRDGIADIAPVTKDGRSNADILTGIRAQLASDMLPGRRRTTLLGELTAFTKDLATLANLVERNS
ncbi:MAG: hypothetical protein AB7P76_00485 [Candidatus Melainabacteria bacterium]